MRKHSAAFLAAVILFSICLNTLAQAETVTMDAGERFTEGRDEEAWAKRFWQFSDLPKRISWED